MYCKNNIAVKSKEVSKIETKDKLTDNYFKICKRLNTMGMTMEAICVSDNDKTYKLQKALNKKELNVNFQFMDDGMLHQDENESKFEFLCGNLELTLNSGY